MKNTHEVRWTDMDGYAYSVKTDFITAGAMFEAMKKSSKVHVVSMKVIRK